MKPLLVPPTLLAVALAACAPDGAQKHAVETPAVPAPATSGSIPAPDQARAPAAKSDPRPSAPADPAKEAEMDARIDKVLGDHTAYRGALARLQAAVSRDDRSGVAALVRYPLDARTQTDKLRIENAQAFVAHYADIMTPAVTKAIIDQRYADLFVSQNGLMLGSGEVWINGVCHDRACVDVDVKVVTFQQGG